VVAIDQCSQHGRIDAKRGTQDDEDFGKIAGSGCRDGGVGQGSRATAQPLEMQTFSEVDIQGTKEKRTMSGGSKTCGNGTRTERWTSRMKTEPSTRVFEARAISM
jgi:hypothetical protein